MSFLSNFFRGTPEKHERVSTLLPQQQGLFQQLMQAMQGKGAGGAFGDSSDYYRNMLSDDPQMMQQFFAPEQRRFQQETIPGLAEQFAGMGSGGLSSSGFRNAAVNAGTDLQERLGAIRAGLKQQAAQGLSGMGQMGLGNYSQDVVTQQGSPGFFSQIAPGIGAGIGMAFGGPMGSAIGSAFGSGIGSAFGKTSPYQSQNTGSAYRSGQGAALDYSR